MDKKILYLGCGVKKADANGGTRVDINPAVMPDIVHDLNRLPWPIETSSFDEIVCLDILEHLTDLVRIMEEVHRVGKPGARAVITTPHFSSSNAYTDPTHHHRLGYYSFDYFTGENQWNFYTAIRFKKVHSEIHFHPNLINKVIWRIANKNPKFYEERLPWIFPAWFLSFELEVIK